MGEVQSSTSESSLARAQIRAREALSSWTMDFRLVTRGGGVVLGLIAVAFAGWYLPGLVRLLIVVAAGLTVLWLRPRAVGPAAVAVVPFAGGVVGWLLLTWGLGLLNPWVGTGLLVLIGLGVQRWATYRRLVVEAQAVAPMPEPESEPLTREPTPDERLDQLLAEVPVGEALKFEVIVVAMAPWMKRSTVAAKLAARAKLDPTMKAGHGLWRPPQKAVAQARPAEEKEEFTHVRT